MQIALAGKSVATQNNSAIPKWRQKVVHHENGGKYTVFYYYLHYRPIEKKFNSPDEAAAWDGKP